MEAQLPLINDHLSFLTTAFLSLSLSSSSAPPPPPSLCSHFRSGLSSCAPLSLSFSSPGVAAGKGCLIVYPFVQCTEWTLLSFASAAPSQRRRFRWKGCGDRYSFHYLGSSSKKLNLETGFKKKKKKEKKKKKKKRRRKKKTDRKKERNNLPMICVHSLFVIPT